MGFLLEVIEFVADLSEMAFKATRWLIRKLKRSRHPNELRDK